MASKSKKLTSAASIFEKDLEGGIRKIPIQEISPNQTQPRQIKDINIDALAKSMAEEGLLQPIVVKKEGGSYKIIAGERRFRAATALKWSEIECRILSKDPKEAFRIAVVENIQRENLEPFEEAVALSRLKEENSYTDKEVAEIVGKSRNYITEVLSIAQIPTDVISAARQAGITSKNMLVQLSLAHRAGVAQEFIKAYQSGAINTVRDAKLFLKNISHQGQEEKKRPLKPQINLDRIKERLSISVQPSDKGLRITTEILDAPETPLMQKNLAKLQKKILESTARILSEFQQK